MSTLAEIEAAAEALPVEEQEHLLHSLSARLRSGSQPQPRARLVPGPAGVLLLEAPPGAPPMTTEAIKQLLEDMP